jgi:hypothetical protein
MFRLQNTLVLRNQVPILGSSPPSPDSTSCFLTQYTPRVSPERRSIRFAVPNIIIGSKNTVSMQPPSIPNCGERQSETPKLSPANP